MQRVPVGKVILIAALCYLIPLLVNVAASFVTTWTGQRSWLVAPALGLAGAILTALVKAFGSADRPGSRPAPEHQDRWPGQAQLPTPPVAYPRRAGSPLPVVLLVAVVVIGLGGWGLTEAIRYAVGYATGNEPGTERLVRPAHNVVKGLRLTVDSVEQTRHFTRVHLTAHNEAGSVISLPLFGNCTFHGSDDTTLKADPSRSDWSESIPAQSRQGGTVIFKAHVPDNVTRAELRFAVMFGSGVSGFGGPPSLVVPMKLHPP
jgi:hypothetical protein